MHPALAEILSRGDELLSDFDLTRDYLRALPPEAVPDLLVAAEDPALGEVRGVLWFALTDWRYPPALARLVDLLDHELDDATATDACLPASSEVGAGLFRAWVQTWSARPTGADHPPQRLQ